LKVLLEASTWFEFWKAITESDALEKRQRKGDTGVEQKLVLTYLLIQSSHFLTGYSKS
jgi:hypothetical protein